MRLVIDIPESILNTIQADEMISREQLAVLQMHILNGKPLPKGHGRLIDADALENYIKDDADEWDDEWDKYALAYVDASPTIIEKG